MTNEIKQEPYPAIPREIKQQMGWLFWNLWNSLLVADPKPAVRDRLLRMNTYRGGDFVVDTSTLYGLLLSDPELKSDLWDGQFVKFLRAERRIVEDETPGYYDTWTENVLVCQNPDGTEFTWTNCDLVAVPLMEKW